MVLMKRQLRYPALLLLGALLVSLASLAEAQQSAPVQELRIQKVGDLTYFHVRLETPAEMLPDDNRFNRGWSVEPSPSLAPRLVGADGQLRLVCRRYNRDPRNRFATEVEPPGLIGGALSRKRSPGEGPRAASAGAGAGVGVRRPHASPRDGEGQAALPRRRQAPCRWSAGCIAHPAASGLEGKGDRPGLRQGEGSARSRRAAKRKEKQPEQPPAQPGQPIRRPQPRQPQPPVRDDLEGLWAIAQVEQFLDLDNKVREFGFYGFAATATARKYGVQGQEQFSPRMGNRFRGQQPPRPGWQFHRPRAV